MSILFFFECFFILILFFILFFILNEYINFHSFYFIYSKNI